MSDTLSAYRAALPERYEVRPNARVTGSSQLVMTALGLLVGVALPLFFAIVLWTQRHMMGPAETIGEFVSIFWAPAFIILMLIGLGMAILLGSRHRHRRTKAKPFFMATTLQGIEVFTDDGSVLGIPWGDLRTYRLQSNGRVGATHLGFKRLIEFISPEGKEATIKFSMDGAVLSDFEMVRKYIAAYAPLAAKIDRRSVEHWRQKYGIPVL